MKAEEKLVFAAKALAAFSDLDDEMRSGAMDMAAIINDPKATEDEVWQSANTLEFMLFPPKGIAEVAAKIEAIPFEHRLFWCEAGGPCACMGCANRCGVTKAEWRRWGKSKGYKLSAWGNQLEGAERDPKNQEDWDHFNLRLSKLPKGEDRYRVIQVLRRHTGFFDLKMANDVAKGAPKVFMENVWKSRAIEIKAELEAAGAEVDMAPAVGRSQK